MYLEHHQKNKGFYLLKQTANAIANLFWVFYLGTYFVTGTDIEEEFKVYTENMKKELGIHAERTKNELLVIF